MNNCENPLTKIIVEDRKYLVGSYAQAMYACSNIISNKIWSFDAELIAKHISYSNQNISDLIKCIKMMQIMLEEKCNPILRHLLGISYDAFVKSIVTKFGMCKFISTSIHQVCITGCKSFPDGSLAFEIE